MRRREFITLLSGAAAWPLAVRAQQSDATRRVGVLGPARDSPAARVAYSHFIDELGKLGFTEGTNLTLDFRRIDQGPEKAHVAANELVAARSDVLFAFGPELSLRAAAAASPATPIVILANNYDPIARGYVKSLAQPGGNITGVFSRQPELAAKQLALLAEALPARKRIAALWDVQSADQFAGTEEAARSLGLSLRSVKLENPPYDFPAAFHALERDDAQAALVLSSPLFARSNVQIAGLAIKQRLPTVFGLRHYVEAGGLLSYGPDFKAMARRAGSHVARILRGAKPSDLPVEQVANYEFILNLKTARAIGIELPTSILLRADEVIE
jgi:putative ABC transport system substrate-binding protein